MPPGTARTDRILLVAALVLLAVCVAVFASRLFGNLWLGDDAFISFRYAQHLAAGEGLVWNPGERIEGYTNFLWVILMAAGMMLGIAPEAASLAIGILCAAGLLGAVCATTIARFGADDPYSWLPTALLCLTWSFAAWAGGGLETQLCALLVFASVTRFLTEREAAGALPLSAVGFALAILTRPDAVVFAATAGAFFLADVVARRRSLQSLLRWALPIVLIVGAHAVWRFGYYGEWLPNTFYAKVGGLWLEQSARYLGLFFGAYPLHWFAPLMLLALWARRDQRTALYFALFIVQLVYIGYVGGDRFEFRFLIPVLPFAFLLITDGLRWLGRESGWPAAQGVAASLALVIAATVGVGSIESIPRPARAGIANIAELTRYADGRIEQGRFLRRQIEAGALPADLVIGLGGAGAVPYYTRWITVDRRGLNDAYIARLPVKNRGWIAHEHDAPTEYLERRGVVIFDVLNKLVHDDDEVMRETEPVWHDGREVDLRAIELGGRFLIFASFVPDTALEKALGREDIRIRRADPKSP